MNESYVPRTWLKRSSRSSASDRSASGKLSSSSQVLCVTHLPQIAGFGDHHYYVEKHTEAGRTVASIQELTGAARTKEIGRMLSGERITPEALRHAEQLIKMAAG